MTSEKGEAVPKPKIGKRIKLVPPDGGWGWMILAGVALSNIFNQSMLSLFALLYGDVLEGMGYNTQGAAVVLSTMIFVANFGGPLAGVILKLTSARVAAVSGACLCTAGILLSGFAVNIWHLVISYGILLGLGLGFIQNSSFVVINSYFKLRKSQAVGLANVGTGVGQTLMPHLVRYLLEHYGYRGACLILAGLSLNGIAGTMLIQPVELHMKKVEEEVDENMRLLEKKNNEIMMMKKDSKTNIAIVYNGGRRATVPSIKKEKNGHPVFSSQRNISGTKTKVVNKAEISNSNHKSDTSPVKISLLKKLYDLFDISLLSSPRFLNIIFGTAICVASIQNFSMIYPFFLQKVANMDKHNTAMCMSAVALADIVGRLVLPTFQDKYQIKARWMLIMTNIWILVVRQILAYQSNMMALLVLSSLYGVGRSMIIVARNIAISDQVRVDQVAAAVGLGMFTMGVIVPPSYYLLGWIRDYTDSYIICLTAQNALTLLMLVMWIPDMYLSWREQKKLQKEMENMALS